MSKFYSYQQIAPERISFSPRWSLHPFLYSLPIDPALSASIRAVGMSHAPLLLADKTEQYFILNGHLRLRVHQQLPSSEKIDCRVVAADINTEDLLTLVWEENNWNRKISRVEAAYFVKICRQYLSDEHIQQRFADLRAVSRNSSGFASLQTLLTLEEPILLALHQQSISTATAETFLPLTSKDRKALFACIAALNLGANKQKRLLQLLFDVAAQQQLSPGELLNTPVLTAILNQHTLNIPQKIFHLFKELQTMANPELDAAEQQFTQWAARLRLPTGVRVEHSQSFETDQLQLLISFPGRQQLELFWHHVHEDFSQSVTPAG